MTGRERFFSGILGALMPICAILLTLDLTAVFSESSGLSTGHIIGISLQFIIFMFVGGTVAYMHSDEVKAYKLFQIGMATPALLASFTTSNGLNSAITGSGESPIVIEAVTESGVNTSFDFNIISSANASENPLDNAPTQQIAMEGGSIIQQVWDGFTGKAIGTASQNQKIEPKKIPPKKKEEPKKEESGSILPPRRPVLAAPVVANDTAATSSTEPTIAPSEVRIETNSVEIQTSAPLRVLSAEEPTTDSRIRNVERLNRIGTTSNTASTSASDNNDRYEQLLRKLRELETMQREIKEQMRSLRPTR
ncbi:MAG: hypothetical protein COV35_07880 [Alphaproteobacteria bacterium CG11_big_fil_rev_8_21_14_0_20_39_49]|nr:MAG: hypothetical protein COV35_07880 [Alphaproteobacteria bacterium CG11_big_fil_rev_8_21_14_0_20_39_49]